MAVQDKNRGWTIRDDMRLKRLMAERDFDIRQGLEPTQDAEIEELNEKKYRFEHKEELAEIEEQKKKEEIEAAVAKIIEEDAESIAKEQAECARLKELVDSARVPYEKAKEKEVMLAEKAQNIKLKINEKNKYMSTLNFFKGKEKKAVAAEIVDLQAELEQVTESQKQAKEELVNPENHYNSCVAEEKAHLAILSEAKQIHMNKIVKKKLEFLDIKQLENGNYSFGRFLQDEFSVLIPKEIEWIFLGEKDGNALLLSKDGLYFNEPKKAAEGKAVTWETSSVRKWLDQEFFQKAFTDEEMKLIADTCVTPDKNPNYDTDPGNEVHDKAFLLSIDEVDKYLSKNESRPCIPSEFCVSLHPANRKLFVKEEFHLSDVLDHGVPHSWYLRTPGQYHFDFAFVHRNGQISYEGEEVDWKAMLIRPAISIKCN